MFSLITKPRGLNGRVDVILNNQNIQYSIKKKETM